MSSFIFTVVKKNGNALLRGADGQRAGVIEAALLVKNQWDSFIWVSGFPSSIHSGSFLIRQTQNIVSEGNTFPIPSASRMRSARTFGDLDVSCDLTHAYVPRMHGFPPEHRLSAIRWTLKLNDLGRCVRSQYSALVPSVYPIFTHLQ